MSGGLRVYVNWDGKAWEVDGELVSYTDALDLYDNTAYTPRRLTVSVHLGNVCQFIGEGHHPATAYVRVVAGDTIIARGTARQLVPGRTGEPTTITLEDGVNFESAPLPSERIVDVTRIDVQRTLDYREEEATQIEIERQNAKKVESSLWFTFLSRDERLAVLEAVYAPSGSTWTSYVEASEGMVYPIVCGNPGRDAGGNLWPAGKALGVDSTVPKLLVAGHACTPGTVWIYGPKQSNREEHGWEEFTVAVERDNAGMEVTTVDISGAAILEHRWSTHPDAQEKEWFFSFGGTSTGFDPSGPAVFEFFLSRLQGVRVDPAGLGAVRAVLSRYNFDFVLDDVQPAWRLFTEGVLPLVPVWLVSGLDGVSFRNIELDPELAAPRFELEDGNRVAVTSRFVYGSTDGSDVVNALDFSFGANRFTDGWRFNMRADARGWSWGQLSVNRFGTVAERLESNFVSRYADARIMARDILHRKAVDRRRGELAVDADLYGLGAPRQINVGDCIRLHAPDEGVNDAPCIVTRITRDGSRTDSVEVIVLA